MGVPTCALSAYFLALTACSATQWGAPIAFMRVLCMLRAVDSKAVMMLQHSWAELSVDDRNLLCHELLQTGLEPAQEAIVLYYAPQLLTNAVKVMYWLYVIRVF